MAALSESKGLFMIITIVCDVLGEANNGTTIAALNLIRSMRERGHTVRVVCSDQNRKGEEGYYVVPNRSFGPLIDAYFEKNGVKMSFPDRRVIDEAIEGADVVHFMTPFALGRRAVKLAVKHDIPLTAGFHCQAENLTSHLNMKDFGLANKLFYLTIWAHSYRHCARIHYPSAFIRDTFERAINRETPACVISNGVNKAFHPMQAERPERYRDRFVIQFTGRYSKEKTHRVLINAVRRSKHGEKIQPVFAGMGPLYEKLRRQGAKLKNPPEFRFFSREDLVKQLNCADLYVHPAEIEIEAISCLEAIACGLVPVIANSRRSATRYFALDERNLFRNKDANDLAEKIDYWIEHPDERAKMRQRYANFVQEHEYEHCMDRMESMLMDAAERRGYVS